MEAINGKCAKFVVKLAGQDEALGRALEEVRFELLDIPDEEVVRPAIGPVTLPDEAAALVAERAPHASPEEKERLDRLLSLAGAFVRAQHDYLYGARPKLIERLRREVAAAEKPFRRLDALAEKLARHGVIPGRELPGRASRASWRSFDERCLHVLSLVELIRVHDGAPSTIVQRAESLANRLHGAREAGRGHLSPLELRNRAFTALRAALDEARATQHRATRGEDSGVFSRAELGLDTTAAKAA